MTFFERFSSALLHRFARSSSGIECPFLGIALPSLLAPSGALVSALRAGQRAHAHGPATPSSIRPPPHAPRPPTPVRAPAHRPRRRSALYTTPGLVAGGGL